jgi:flagellar biosynthesis protein FliP
LVAQTALPVQKVIQQMSHLASVPVMPPLILLMTGLLKIKETSTASMRGQSVGLQNLAPVRVALGLKVFTARLSLTVRPL